MACWRRGVSVQVAGRWRPFSGILLGQTGRRWTEGKCTLEAHPGSVNLSCATSAKSLGLSVHHGDSAGLGVELVEDALRIRLAG